ncbi:LOW QUALITY PROTEIN: anoctamin-7 [Megaptera novaeangliae]
MQQRDAVGRAREAGSAVLIDVAPAETGDSYGSTANASEPRGKRSPGTSRNAEGFHPLGAVTTSGLSEGQLGAVQLFSSLWRPARWAPRVLPVLPTAQVLSGPWKPPERLERPGAGLTPGCTCAVSPSGHVVRSCHPSPFLPASWTPGSHRQGGKPHQALDRCSPHPCGIAQEAQLESQSGRQSPSSLCDWSSSSVLPESLLAISLQPPPLGVNEPSTNSNAGRIFSSVLVLNWAASSLGVGTTLPKATRCPKRPQPSVRMAALSSQPTSQPAGEAHACPLGFWPFGDPDGCDMRDVQDEDSVVRRLLFSAPWAVLRCYTEDLGLKLPLQELPDQASNWAAACWSGWGVPNILLEDVPNIPRSYSCQFKVSNLSRFLGSENQATFFPVTYRHQILFEILAKTPYGHERKRLFGTDQLLGEGVFSAALPLHDGPLTTAPEGPRALGLTQRQVRLQPWARWRQWHKYQPLDHVRRYFGEKVAFYFARLRLYTGWLVPAAGAGTLVSLVGCLMVSSDAPRQELCGSGDSFALDCPFWLLSGACALVQAGRFFDHGGTVFFSLFMALWAMPLREFWERKSSTLACRWGCSDYEDIEERPRPQSAASAPTTAVNPIAGEGEPYFPKRSRLHRVLAGSAVVMTMAAVVVMCLVSIVLHRAIMAVTVSRPDNTPLAAWASRVASLTRSTVNLVFILNLSKVYVALACVLTKWETHRTQTKFEDAFTLKVFIFQFVNFYSSPIYTAFFKGRFVGHPGNCHTSPGVRSEECAAGGCLTELAQELLVIMVGKQIIYNVQEILVPPQSSPSWEKRLGGRQVRPLLDPSDSVTLTCLRALQGSLARPRPHPCCRPRPHPCCRPRPHPCCRRCKRPHPRTAHPVAPDPPPPAALCLQSDQDPAWEDRAIVLGVSVSRELGGWWQRSQLRSKERKAGLARCPGRQADFELLPFQGLFDGHLEMVLHSGFITVFVAACLLAPLFALLNDWVEIRLDARKFGRERRRPVAECAQDIGIWFHILAAITRLAVIGNAFLLAFSSDLPPRAYHQWSRARNLRGSVNFTLARAPPAFAAPPHRTCRYRAFRGDDGRHARTHWNLLAIRLAFIIVCEHMVFSVGRVLDLLVPDIPGSVEIKVKRECYLAKQALAENEVLFGTNGAEEDQPLGSEMNLGPQA